MDYSFNPAIAAIYGVDGAVMIHNLHWWIEKNEANGRHFYEGKSWTYNSMKAFAVLFPFWSEKQIRRIIDNLKNNGAIYVGHFNQKGFDRTQWYALSDEVLSVYNEGKCNCLNGQMDKPKRANASAQMGEPIPVIKQQIVNSFNNLSDSQDGCDKSGSDNVKNISEEEKFYQECVKERTDKIAAKLIKDGNLFGNESLSRLENIVNNLPQKLMVNQCECSHETYLKSLLKIFSGDEIDTLKKLDKIFSIVDEQFENGSIKNKFKYTLTALYNSSQGI